MLNVSLLWCANSILPSLISVISQLFQLRCKKNSTPASYFIRLHGTGRRNFCSLHDSHNRKRIIPIHQQGEGTTVVQNKAGMAGNFHILIPGHFISPDKDWFLSKFNPGWETLRAQMEPQMQKWGTLTKVHPGRWQVFRRYLSFNSKRTQDVWEHDSVFLTTLWHVLNLLPLGLLRPEKPITFFKHALYQGSLPFLSNP